MKRPLSIVSDVATLVAKVVASPVVFGWLVITHYKPQLLKTWNPTPVKVLRVVRNDSCTLHGEHGCVMAFDAPSSFQDGRLSSPDRLRFSHDAKPYLFSVNRPELLRFPSKSTLKRIARDFEPYGLRVKQIHVQVGNGRSTRTIIHELV